MNREGALEQARDGRLYPGIILHGGSPEERFDFALELSRILLCSAQPEARPCGKCSHCRRIADPTQSDRFHPDFIVLGRDLKTSTSVDAPRACPKSSLSSSVSEIAAQLTATNGPDARVDSS